MAVNTEDVGDFNRKQLSSSMSIFLDEIGYSRDRIEARRKESKESTKDIRKKNDCINNTLVRFDTLHCAGSHGEGVTLSMDSDHDILFVDSRTFDSVMEVIPANPGYVFLVDKGQQNLQAALLTLKDYFERPKQATAVGNIAFTPNSRQGPSMETHSVVPSPSGRFKHVHKFDIVHGLQCRFPAILDAWCKRRRYHGWPSIDTVDKVASLPAILVNVGLKGSYLYDYQWRISFTPAEMYLISTFNDTQMKVYVLLKMIAKNVLKSVCDDVTSYIIKNVAFWYFERNHVSSFTDELLLDTLYGSLELLKKSVEERSLPNYMIPERNLFQGKLQSRENTENLLKAVFNIQAHLDETIRGILESQTTEAIPIFLQTIPALKLISMLDSFGPAVKELMKQWNTMVGYLPPVPLGDAAPE